MEDWLFLSCQSSKHPSNRPFFQPSDLASRIFLEASRTQDLSDLSRMLGLASAENLDRARAIVQRYAPDAAEDIESLIYLGQLELKAPPQTSKTEIDV